MEKTNEKEVAIIRQEVSQDLITVNKMVIKTNEDANKATDIRSTIKRRGQAIKERKEEITRPLLKSLASTRDLFRPIEQAHKQATDIIGKKMLDYREAEEKRQEEVKAKLADRVNRGTMKPATAIDKIGKMEVPATFKGKIGSATIRIDKKFEVVDIKKLPIEYLLADETKIRAAMYKGIKLEGVRYYEKKTLSGK